MQERILKILLLICPLVISERCPAVELPVDSVGIIISGNYSYILHQVEKDENLFRLSLRYHVQVKDIVRLNPGSEKMIRTNQKLKIPYYWNKHKTTTVEDSVSYHSRPLSHTTKVEIQPLDSLQWHDIMNIQHKKNPDKILSDTGHKQGIIERKKKGITDPITKSREDRNLIHLVKWGETVYSIAKRYHVKTEDIISWNRLEKNKIYAGQELIVRLVEGREEEQPMDGDRRSIDSNNQTLPGNLPKFKDYDQESQDKSERNTKSATKTDELKESLLTKNPEKLNRIHFKPLPIEYQLAIIYVATRGYLDSVPVDDMTDFEKEYIDYLKSQHSDVLVNLREGVLDERATLIMRDVALDLAENYH